jgi:hypothetical protein
MARAASRAVPVTLDGWQRRSIGKRFREVLSWPLADLL